MADFQLEAMKTILWASDMPRAVRFYREVFGFTVGFESVHWSELKHGDAILALHGGGNGERQPSSLSLQVSDLDRAVAVCAEFGATVLKQPESREGEPIRLAEMRDPEGNEFSLTQFVG
ncbi:MAG: VOC family protein [Planctomycetota bacterium]